MDRPQVVSKKVVPALKGKPKDDYAALKKERKRQKLTMAQLSEMTGIDQAALSRLESGKNSNPTLETMNRIAAALGKSITCSLKDVPRKQKRVPETVV